MKSFNLHAAFVVYSRTCCLVGLGLVLVIGLPTVQAAEVPEFPFYPPYDELTDFLEYDPSPIAVIRELEDGDGTPYLSSDGRPIRAIKISDNPELEEDETTFLFIGVIHGREPLGVRVVLDLVEDLTERYASADPEVRDWVDSHEIWLVPVMNPDGYDNRRRPNANDVDLNRNFGFRWDRCVTTPGPPSDPVFDCSSWPPPVPHRSRYRGDFAFSEPETEAIRDLVLEQRPSFGITFHSGRGDGAGELQKPWDDDPDVGDDLAACLPGDPPDDDQINLMPVDSDRLRAVGELILEAVEDSRNRPGGRFCNGTSSITDACAEPDFITTGPIGQSAVYHHGAAGTFDYQLETSTELYRDDFLYEASPAPLTADEQEILDNAREYVRNYVDAIRELFRYPLCDATPPVPGVTGHVFDHDGNPLPATIKVLDSFDGMHDDDIDDDGDVDEVDRHTDFDDSECDGVLDPGDAPIGDPEIEFRRADQFGRYLRLLEEGTYTLEFSLAAYPTVTREVVVDLTGDPCLEVLDVFLQSPPEADAGDDQEVECASFDGATITLDGSASTDPDSSPGTNDDIVLFEWFEDFGLPGETLLGTGETLSVTLSLGSHIITLQVTDMLGETDTDEVVVEVVDTTPPSIQVALNPNTLWPPNHRLVEIEAAVMVEDVCDASPFWILTSIISNEPDDGRGDGDFPYDIQEAAVGEGDTQFLLRSERSGIGDGRVYIALYTATDASGNPADGEAAVRVPSDRRGRASS